MTDLNNHVIEVHYFFVSCDQCHAETDYVSYAADAVYDAHRDGYRVIDGRVLCPVCQEQERGDEGDGD